MQANSAGRRQTLKPSFRLNQNGHLQSRRRTARNELLMLHEAGSL